MVLFLARVSAGAALSSAAAAGSENGYLPRSRGSLRWDEVTLAGKMVLLKPGQGSAHRIADDRFVTKGGPTQRTDAFSVIEYTGAAGVPGPPPHRHRSFEEAWYILDGEVRFTTPRRSVSATAGTYLLVPRGVSHTFQVIGKKPARWLGIFSPGRYVGLVEELGALFPKRGPPDPKAIARLFAKYDTDLD